MSKKKRLFIAVPLSDEIRNNLKNIVKTLKPLSDGVKWVKPENFHLTLKFLGETQADKVEGIISALEDSVEGLKPFIVSVQGISAFPGLKRPRVIKCCIARGNKELINIFENIEKNLEPLEIKKEERKFIPHITLSRIKKPVGNEELMKEISKLPTIDLGEMECGRISLVRSRLTRSGPIYTTEKEFILK